MECLGWSHPYIQVEQKDDAGGWADYLLGEPVKAALEAKREAVKFDLLPAAGASTVQKLRPLVSACKHLEKAVLQVLSYCTLHGSQVAIVCNGPQLVVFQSYIAGQSPLDGESFVFNGFASYDKHFALLWKLLSPEGLAENRAYQQLSRLRNPRILTSKNDTLEQSPSKNISKNVGTMQTSRFRISTSRKCFRHRSLGSTPWIVSSVGGQGFAVAGANIVLWSPASVRATLRSDILRLQVSGSSCFDSKIVVIDWLASPRSVRSIDRRSGLPCSNRAAFVTRKGTKR